MFIYAKKLKQLGRKGSHSISLYNTFVRLLIQPPDLEDSEEALPKRIEIGAGLLLVLKVELAPKHLHAEESENDDKQE